MKPISLKKLFAILDVIVDSEELIFGYSINSKEVNKGDLFFALPGAKVDGHTFLSEVASRGGVAAVVRKDYAGDSHGLFLIRVEDVLKTLQGLARNVLAKRQCKVVGITGTLGKTTTKEFAAQLLKNRYRVFSTPRSFNSQITLPLSILLADEDAEILLLEMGMSEPGNLEKLVSIAPPDVAVLTTVAIQHADQFSDGLAGIAREKSSIFSSPRTQLGILHAEIPFYEEVHKRGICPKKTFSLQNKASDFYLSVSDEKVLFRAEGATQELFLNLPLQAHYQNFLAAAALAFSLGLSMEEIKEAARFLKTPSMRFEMIERNGILFINDAYNANPDSMRAALEGLPRPKPGGKKIAVLSEMNALGMYSQAGHALVAESALQTVDILLCIGSKCETMRDIWKREKKQVELFENKEDLKRKLQECISAGDVVLFKGARAYALETILSELI